MKYKSTLITIALALSCGGSQALDLPETTRADHFHPQQSFTELAGRQVWNYQNEMLGRIKFITADLENARLVEVVIASGGFFGLGGKLTSAPPRAFKLDETQQVMRLDVSKAHFEASPPFKTSNATAYSDKNRVAAVIRHYGLQPWFYLEGQVESKNAEILQLGHVERSDRILGLPIESPQGQYLGQVGGLQMDLPKGQIVHVVNDMQGMGGHDSYILQARALRYNAKNNGLILNESLKTLKGEPSLQWVGSSRQSFREESFVNRKLKADHGRDSTQNAEASIDSKTTAMQQGADFRDVQKTNLIKQRIQADPRLSAIAKNVLVITLNAQTTLRGHVNSDEERRKIGEIAMKAGRPENVSNQLEVAPARASR
jgi:sporulation protein YlmC with PRC-barrel domain